MTILRIGLIQHRPCEHLLILLSSTVPCAVALHSSPLDALQHPTQQSQNHQQLMSVTAAEGLVTQPHCGHPLTPWMAKQREHGGATTTFTSPLNTAGHGCAASIARHHKNARTKYLLL